ncbi:MAG TPA: toprim domain-containing protein, partial [Candidatus Aenigmarchaeota archaeon]|nr:toprim domain-containing protein [Candidatus Aenigmarchaeota archaeon]
TVHDAKRYKIGFAPKNLFQVLRQKGLLELAKKAGITKAIQERITFTFFDHYNNPVGFAARSIGDTKPKYINILNSPLFKKEHFLFGLNFLAKKEEVYMVEGYLDAITCFKTNIPAVAIGGTSLSVFQLNLLKPFSKIIIAFDGDKAGVRAAFRALKISIKANIPLFAVFLPQNEDPDSLIRKKGKNAFLQLEQKDLFKFFIEKLMTFPPQIAVKKLSNFRRFLKETNNDYSLILLKHLKEINKSIHIGYSLNHQKITPEKQILYALFSNRIFLKKALNEDLLEILDPEIKEAAFLFLETNALPHHNLYTPILAKALIKPAPETAVLKVIKYLQTKKLKNTLKEKDVS